MVLNIHLNYCYNEKALRGVQEHWILAYSAFQQRVFFLGSLA